MGKRGPKHTFEKYPEELRKVINEQIKKGITYRELTSYINNIEQVQKGELKGTSIAGVQRYASSFKERLEHSKAIREQVAAIIEETGDTPDTEMVDVANKIAIEMVVERLLGADVASLENENILDIIDAITKLQRSSATSEKLKLQYKKYKTDLENKKEAALKELKEAIFIELEENHPDVYKKLVEIADKTFAKIEIKE